MPLSLLSQCPVHELQALEQHCPVGTAALRWLMITLASAGHPVARWALVKGASGSQMDRYSHDQACTAFILNSHHSERFDGQHTGMNALCLCPINSRGRECGEYMLLCICLEGRILITIFAQFWTYFSFSLALFARRPPTARPQPTLPWQSH